MKRFFLFLYVIFISLAMVSCGERKKIESMMADFIKTKIVIPNDLECICRREVKTIDLESIKENRLVIYYDSLDCSSCRISHLEENFPLYEMADTGSFSLLTIFSPRVDELEEVRLQLMLINFQFPIYVDVNGSFSRQNASIPSDLRFHNFLVGPDNHPLFVGNPLANDKLFDLFQEVLIQSNIINN